MAPVAVTEAVREAGGTSDRPWWTEADQAELDCLLWELVDAAFAHREAGCSDAPCRLVSRAIETVLEWRTARDLRSYARWVRLQLDLIELEEDRLVHRLRGRV